jgi:S-formylglutathione hydrolase FrmB
VCVRKSLKTAISILVLTILFFPSCGQNPQYITTKIEFHIQYAENVTDGPVSCRLYVIFDKNIDRTPRYGPSIFSPDPFFAIDVKDWKPGETVVLDNNSLGYPVELDRIPPEVYAIQAVMDLNTTHRSFSIAPGNGYSQKTVVEIEEGETHIIELAIDQVVEEQNFKESEYIKYLAVPSQKLSEFYGWEVSIEAAVILPESYSKDSSNYFPTVYVFPGWGATHLSVLRGDYQQRRYGMRGYGLEKVFVYFNQECPLGYHVFADSENNGPWASALIEDFIPAFEKSFRVISAPTARFLTGQSSGGWASLWLQITRPETFGGVWAASPDPVDFRDFIGCNIYKSGANLYDDPPGHLGAILRRWSRMEQVIGDGEQMRSFEAVFSPRGADGRARPIYDRETGTVFPDVAEFWKSYDIQILLVDKLRTNAADLQEKIHIYAAEDDEVGLDESAKLLRDSVDEKKMPIDVVIYPSGGHGVWRDEMRERIHRQMDAVLLANHPELRKALKKKP